VWRERWSFGIAPQPSTAGISQFTVIQSVAPPVGVAVSPINLHDPGEIEHTLWEWRSDRYNERVGGISLRPRHACGSAQIARGLFRGLLRYRGGLISYGPNYPDQYRRGAGYVDRIRKWEKPADLLAQAPNLVSMMHCGAAIGRCGRTPILP